MLYRDLVQFESLESIIQLLTADQKATAGHLVETYVISDRMADLLRNLVLPNLQIDRPADNKGILVVGNYGTGKTHLMAVLSAVAEHADLAASLRNAAVRTAAAPIAGKFKVLRMELGGVEKGLRDIVLDELQTFLAHLGCPYAFPAATAVTNNKGALIAAMSGFTEHHPGQGLLLVVDELLDYLRTREQRALILDLGFLRELGEVIELTPLRLLSGVQETLFDNPRFGFVADQLRRVRDRFEQVRIAREDIAFVVAERLLRKDDAQLARITEHLRPFARLYPPLAERLGEFARLFPIHPAYIETFEQVYIAEKREVMKTFTLAIREVLDREVPADQPGLISYDHYWGLLRDNPSLRSLPGVTKVVEASDVLAGRVQNAYTRRQLLPMAQRIIRALSVHRLTTSDIRAPIGVTVEELRDNLTLWAATPEPDAEFLAGTIQVALREIIRTVSGQFIAHNEENGQYYLDPTKVVDFDAQIAERGDFLDRPDLNTYFFAALQSLLGLPESVYVTGYSIWSYELPWVEHNVTRPGYIFFGAPNERSTAQPPRDFYVYVLPPFTEGAPAEPATPNADEVIFSLQGVGSDFEALVRSYAGARDLAATASEYRDTYSDKAGQHLRRLITWLRNNLTSHLRILYRGVQQTVPEALAQTRSSASRDPEELLRVIAASKLALHFGDAYPDYPGFTRVSQPITEAARPTAAMDAVRFLATRSRTNLAIAVLEGLKLLDDTEAVRPLNSPYARHLLERLHAKADPNQVVNAGEVIEQVASGAHPVFKDTRFGLEPEWVAVALLALVYDGQITLNLGGNETLDAGNLERAAAHAIADLTDFRYYGRTRDVPLPVWGAIFDAFDLQVGLLRDESTRTAAVTVLQAKVQEEQRLVAAWQSQVQGGLRLWNDAIFTDSLRFTSQEGAVVEHSTIPVVSLSQADLLPYLRKTKEFLENLARYNTAGKLRNLRLSLAEVTQELGYRRTALRMPALLDAINRLQPAAAYLSEAAANLPADHVWVQRARAAKDELLNAVRRLAQDEAALEASTWARRLETLRREYVDIYSAAHAEGVLGPAGDDRRVRLLRDPRVEQLKLLAQIDILNRAEFQGWSDTLTGMLPCREFHPGLLTDSPTCPRCNYRPSQAAGGPSASARLDALELRLDALLVGWHTALRQTLASETAGHSIAAMTPQERGPLDAYMALADPANEVLPTGLAAAANQALHGIETVSLNLDALEAALRAGGLPCTVEQLTERFRGYLRGIMTGHDGRNTRIMMG